jgi:AraC-like DNA-binding protein
MQKAESVNSFFERQIPGTELDKEFNVFDRKTFNNQPCEYNRRDFYKITLMIGSIRFDYADKGILIDKPSLVFSNPLIPYSWQLLSEEQEGFFCVFSEDFLKVKNHDIVLQESPLFKIGADTVFPLDPQQVTYISQIFENMLKEFHTDYVHRYDLLGNHVNLLIHEALKMQPSRDHYYKHNNAAERIAAMFLELLDRQFHIDSPRQTLKLKTANQYAEHLSVHVNYLNRAVKEITGKTTTEHLKERIINCAKTLLIQTDWTVNQISNSLGYEYANYFNNFFKKHTGATPLSLRKAT